MENSLTLDVLVMGGGPAGSACAARLAGGGAVVGLIDAGGFSRFRIGETLGSRIAPALATIGLSTRSAAFLRVAWPRGPIASVWGAERGAHAAPGLRDPYGPGWLVDRRAFDRMLFERALSLGARGMTETRVVGVERNPQEWRFELDRRGHRLRGRARFVVEATGRKGSSPFAPCRQRIRYDRQVALALRGPCIDTDSSPPPSTFIESVPAGWWYSVVLTDRVPLAVLFTDADLLPRGRSALRSFVLEQLAAAPRTSGHHATRLASAASIPWRGFDASTSIRRVALSDGWVAVGDALMAFDPLSGQGVLESLNSAIEVADGLLSDDFRAGLTLRESVASCGRRFNEHLVQRHEVYAEEPTWPEAPYWKRRHAGKGVQIAQTAAVEAALSTTSSPSIA